MPTFLKPGDGCDGHVMERLLGVGRSAEVWAARGPDGALCAFKIMAVEGTDKAKARFAQEGEALVRVSHPSVVRVLGAGLWEGRVWLALELVEGETLAQKVRRVAGVAPPPLDDVLDWIQQVCEGLAAAHERGIVHRDLSADNIMITREGRARLLDFGMARMRSWGLKTTNDVQLGAKNMAPEQFRAGEACPGMDIYGLGYVSYQVLAGVHPLGDDEITVMQAATFHLLKEPRPLQEVAPWAPPDLVALTHEMMAKDPAQRPPSMRAVIARLQLVRRGLSAHVLQAVRSVPGLHGAPAMAATIPMAASDVPASAPAPATSAPPTSWPATSWPATSAPATSIPGRSAPGTCGPATSAPAATAAPLGAMVARPDATAADRIAMLPAAGTTLVSAMVRPVAGPMSAFDSEKPPKREMVTTSGVEVLVDAPLPAAPAARAPRRTSSPASVFIRNLEKKWGKFIRMKLHRPDIPPASAEEMHQEVLVTLFEEYKKQNGPPEHEQAFLDKVILNEIRRHGRRRPEVAQGADVEGVAASAPDPQGAVERVQLWRRLEHHIGELSQQEREVLTAREMHEMTFEVIALMLGRPYGTIVEQHARAMQKLEDIARASERAAARGARRRRRSFEK